MGGKYVLGVDFGTDSVRVILIDSKNGDVLSAATSKYSRWGQGLYCNAGQQMFRQHPLDYIESLEEAVHQCLSQVDAGIKEAVKGMAIDTTGSTPVAVNEAGVPLALMPGFEENPNAMFVLWKDHTATAEAEEINKYAATQSVNYLKYVGGIYSSEWYWAKLLKVLRSDEAVRQAAYSFVEHSDWLPFLLTGGNHVSQIKRNVCAAGHKALWAGEFGGFPPDHFFTAIDPLLKGFVLSLPTYTYPAGSVSGFLSAEWAVRLGLSEQVVVSVGVMDAHAGAVGGEIEPYQLAKVMGTSTCDMLVAPMDDFKGKFVKGISGQVVGSIIPGMMGLEAGQSAFGDVFAWFARLLSFGNYALDDTIPQDRAIEKVLEKLNEACDRLPQSNSIEPLALDWLNGRRTPDADYTLRAGIFNLHLAHEAPHIFKSLVEATCFGAKAILDRFLEEGVRIDGVIALGGVAQKSKFVMQTMADVLQRPIRVHRSSETCALGAAMFAAVAAGIHATVPKAMQAMGQGFMSTYQPNPEKSDYYQKRFNTYKQIGVAVPPILREMD